MPRSRETGKGRGRLEMKAPAEWIDEVSRVAESLGLSLSAYVRLAVNERIQRDRAAANPPKKKAPRS
jgi:hypothetical protein